RLSAGILQLHVEDDVRIRKRDGPHELGEVSFRRGKSCAGSTHGGRRRRASHGRKDDLREPGLAQYSLSGGELAELKNVGREIRRLVAAEAPREVEGHRLLNFFDEIRERLGAPAPKEAISHQGRTRGALHRIAVTSRALCLIELLS